jgi:ATP-dependent DNA helicase RecG
MSFSPELIENRENDNVDFKVDASSPEKIVHDIGAMANAHGGCIIVGVADDGAVVGIDDFQDAEATIMHTTTARTKPQLAPTIFSYTHSGGKELLIVEVNYFEGADPLEIKPRGKNDWIVYERVGSVSQAVSEERVEQMRRERRGTDTTDQVGSGLGLDALDRDLIEEKFGAVALSVDEGLLQSSEIAREINGELQLTNAGLLAFGLDPQAVFQDAYMLCGRYAGQTKTTRTSSRELNHSPLLTIIDEAEAFIRERTGEFEHQLTGLQQETLPHYSPTVVRELLVNAIAHADYSQQGVFSVQIFSDRLEITSPGRFPSGMTEQQVRNGVSRPRNRAMVTVLRRLRYVEQSGSAWDKAKQAEADYGYPLPRWEEPGYNVRAIVPIHPQVGVTPSSEPTSEPPAARRDRRDDIVAFLSNGPARVSDIAGAIGLKARQTRTWLARLEQEGRVEVVGDAATTDPNKRYQLANQ